MLWLTATQHSRQPGPFSHSRGQESSLKVIKEHAGHEVAAGARGSMPLSPIRGLDRLESWSSFEIHHDTGPGRHDIPTMEALLPCQLRADVKETGIWGSGEGFK